MFLGKSFIYGNFGDSCQDFETTPHISECYLSFFFVWLSVVLGIFGIFANWHIIWVYAISRKLKSSSDQLAFTYGSLDSVSCVVTVIASVLILTSSGKTCCVFYTILYILMTRVALYLFTFSAFNRHFMVCLREDRFFYDYKRTKLILLILVLMSVGEMVLQCYTGCFQYSGIGVLFVEDIAGSQPSPSWTLDSIAVLDWINWILLVAITFVLIYLYKDIAKSERQNEDFRFNDPEYDHYYERKVTRMFRWTTILAITFLYPQVIIQAVGYYLTLDHFSGGFYFNVELTVMLTMISDFINLMMFVLTPVIYFWINVQFREDVKRLWTGQVVVLKRRLYGTEDKDPGYRFSSDYDESEDGTEDLFVVNETSSLSSSSGWD